MPAPKTDRPFIVELKDVQALDEETMEKILLWVDKIPLSKSKKHLTRDFSDGVLVAEIIKYFLPKYVDLHNFSGSNAAKAKEDNWHHLNRKVMTRFGLQLSEGVVRDLCLCKPRVIEHVLCVLREKLDVHMIQIRSRQQGFRSDFLGWTLNDRPRADHVTNPRANNAASPRKKHGNEKDFKSLEDFYLTKGLKLFPKEEVQKDDRIYNSPRLSPKQKRSIASLTEKVPREELDSRIRLIAEKENTIKTLHGKIERLERLLHLKDIRVKDLSLRVQAMEDRLIGSATMSSNWSTTLTGSLMDLPSGGKHRHLDPLSGGGGRRHPETIGGMAV